MKVEINKQTPEKILHSSLVGMIVLLMKVGQLLNGKKSLDGIAGKIIDKVTPKNRTGLLAQAILEANCVATKDFPKNNTGEVDGATMDCK